MAPLPVLAEVGNSEDTLVEIEIGAGPDTPYKERRGLLGVQFSAGYQSLLPDNYVSPIDGFGYEDLFGSNEMGFLEVKIGPKLNFGPFGLFLEFIYGMGSVESRRTQQKVTLEMTKRGGAIGVALDGLFPEPYFVPYGSFQMFTADYYEHDEIQDPVRDTAGTSTAITAGVLIQLNWIEPDVSIESRSSVGLENTFLDIYAIQYQGSQDADAVKLDTAWNWGAGIRLEY